MVVTPSRLKKPVSCFHPLDDVRDTKSHFLFVSESVNHESNQQSSVAFDRPTHNKLLHSLFATNYKGRLRGLKSNPMAASFSYRSSVIVERLPC